MSGDLHIIIGKTDMIDDKTFQEFVDHRLHREVGPMLMDAVLKSRTPLLVGPLQQEMRQDFYHGFGDLGFEFIVPVKAVTIDYQPRYPEEWRIVWTFWRRLKFLFTGKLPIDGLVVTRGK